MFVDVRKRVIIVTGANTGIGLEVCKRLCEGGHDVILACRDPERGKKAVATILETLPAACATFMKLDLADLASVRCFVKEFLSTGRDVDVLINNAGVFLKSSKMSFTKDNFELMMGTNHLGHFLLTNLLLESLKKTGGVTGDSRVVMVSSGLHGGKFRNIDLPPIDMTDVFLPRPESYESHVSYKNSKLSNILFGYELARRMQGTGVFVNSLTPGYIPNTELVRHASPTRLHYLRNVLGAQNFARTVEQGAGYILRLAVDQDLRGVTGKYYREDKEGESSEESRDEGLARELWHLSARYCHLDISLLDITSVEDRSLDITSVEDKNPVITSMENKNPVITSMDDMKPVITSVEGKSLDFTSVEDKNPVITSVEDKNPVVISVEVKNPVITSMENKNPVITSMEDKNPVITSVEDKNPVVTSMEDKNPVITSVEDKNPVVTSMEDKAVYMTSLKDNNRDTQALKYIALRVYGT